MFACWFLTFNAKTNLLLLTFPEAGVHTLLKRPAKVLTQCSYGVRNKVEKFKQNQPHKKENGTLYTQTAKIQPKIYGYKKTKY